MVSDIDTNLDTLFVWTSLKEVANAKMKYNDSHKEEVSLIHGLFEALHMKNRDGGTVNDAQRHKGLSARYKGDKKEEHCKTSKSSTDEMSKNSFEEALS